MNKKELKQKILDGTATNEDVAVCWGLGLIYREVKGKCKRPNWLSNTDDARKLINNEHHKCYMISTPIENMCSASLYLHGDYPGEEDFISTGSHKSLPTAIVLAVLEIEDE